MKNFKTFAFCALALLSFSTVQAASFSAGFSVTEEVSAAATGIPVYPGAIPVRETKGEKESAKVQIAFGDFGLKVVAAKLQSADSVGKIAEYYRVELARFGRVLDCGKLRADNAAPPSEGKSKAMTCEDSKPRKNGVIFKAGKKKDQRVVEIYPAGEGSEFSLVHVVVRGTD